METSLFNHSQVFSFKDKVEYSEEGITSKRVIQKNTGNVSLFAFDKGQSLSEHTAPFDALIQILEGSAEIIIDGKAYSVDGGGSIIMPAHIPHAVNAKERFKMLLTMIKEPK
jgi:quercetin dioxygenase-like cupin family protein